MTSQEWQDAVDPRLMLRSSGEWVTAREAMRFACACCDRVRAFIRDPRSVKALEVLERAITGGVDPAVIDAAAGEAQQAAWLAVREFCVPILGEEEFNREVRMLRTGPDPFERMASVDPAYLAAEAVKCAILCVSEPRNAEYAARYAAEAVARRSADVDTIRADEWARQAALLRRIVGGASGVCVPQSAAPDPVM